MWNQNLAQMYHMLSTLALVVTAQFLIREKKQHIT